MADLVIVESPAKARTIERYLGGGYTVMASYGHIRDLPKSDFAIEVDGDGGCRLTYEVPGSSTKHVAALRQAARSADRVWLAPDLDREGEAIAWHVAEVLDLDLDTTNRVTFDEITQDAIREAFANPRHLDVALVDAQQARRAVDRIVGYRLSPVLWRTVAAGISAGRVQSVALRLIVDREDEIRAFVPQEYWDLTGWFARDRDEQGTIEATLHSVGGQRLVTPRDLARREEIQATAGGDGDDPLAGLLLVGDEDTAQALDERARGLSYRVDEVRRTQSRRNPKPAFTTSTLQQDAANQLGFSARQTMAVAQQLYEGVALGAEGETGLITYMRTDSVNLSATALGEISQLVAADYGARYTLGEPRRFATRSKGAQEAHEAIRPTSVRRAPERLRRHLSRDQAALYELIWKRTVATQMTPAVYDRVSADVVGHEDPSGDAVELLWRVTGQVLKFDGYLRVYRDDGESDAAASDRLPDIDEGQALDLREVVAEQHFTQPPPRYTEATLVKTLEAEGIGRPSTYASIIGTIAAREYVRLDSRRFFPTPLGEVVTSFLKAHFGEVVDVNFTARMESTLDEIARGEQRWCQTVTRFLGEVDTWVDERKPERPRLPLLHPADCPVCGAAMERVFSGRSKQWFASCSRWPDCEGTLPLNDDGTVGEPEPEPEPDERVRCPVDDAPMLLREGRYGRFFGCVNYPACKGIRNVQRRLVYRGDGGELHPFRSPTDPGSYMELRLSRYGKPFVGSTGYPDDRFAVWSVPIARPCPECGAPLRSPPRNRKTPVAVCTNPDVAHVFDADDFNLPEVATVDVVPGVEAYDPELGGEPLEPPGDVPAPFPLRLTGTRAPAAPKATAKKRGAGRSRKRRRSA